MLDQVFQNISYDYERWPSDLLSWWREVRARVPDNMTVIDYDVMEEFPGGSYVDEPPATRQISEQEARALRAANILRLYYTPCVAVLGVLSSLLAIPVLSRVGRLTSSSHVPYLLGLSVCTLLYLVGLLMTWLGSLGVNVYGVPGTCQFTAFISQASHFLYTWIMVALVADRLAGQLLALKVCPGWLSLVAAPARAKVLILILAALSLAVFFNLSMMEGTVHLGAAKICVVIVDYLTTSLILDKIDAILNFFIPFLLMVVVDIVLILNHCRLKLRRVPLDENSDAGFPADPFRPSPSPSTESSTPDPVPVGGTSGGGATTYPSVSSIIVTVTMSGIFTILSLPTTIQKTVSTFADDHLLFTMTARGILYQHSFANLFYTAFLSNIILILCIDVDVRRQLRTMLRDFRRAAARRLCCRTADADEEEVENGSNSECPRGQSKTDSRLREETVL